MIRALVTHKGVPLRLVKDAAASEIKTADPVEQYVNRLVSLRPGVPRDLVKKFVDQDLERLALGETLDHGSMTYRWTQTEEGLSVSYK